MAKIVVLKPFMFSTHPKDGGKLPTERFFSVGEHEVPDEIINHPWIRDTLAEGRIESPAQTLARTKKAAEDAAKASEEAQRATDAANAAFARLKAAEPGAKGTAEEIAEELNTPIPELKRRQAEKMAKATNAPANDGTKKAS